MIFLPPFVFAGIHTDAMFEWAYQIEQHSATLLNAPTINDRLRILQDLADNINGVGDAVVQNISSNRESTLLEIYNLDKVKS